MNKKSSEFSKTLLKQESALIWIMSLSFIVLAFYCIHEGFTGSLPWLAAMVGFPWTAYGVSQAMYYRKAMKENTSGGIKYETVLEEARRAAEVYQNAAGFDFSMYDSGIDPFANATKTTSVTYEVTENVDEY
jgi:hypothetical protein